VSEAKKTSRALFLALATSLTAAAAPAAASEYYAGKTIELIVGAAPGGGYDIYARAVARHLGRHVPGSPAIVVKNMPGAGSAKAAQYITNIAPKDGTSVAGIMPGAIMGPLLDERAAPMFDPNKVRYLGTVNSGTRVCVTLKGGRINSFEDAQKIKSKFGGSAPNDSTYEYGYLHKHTSGAVWDVVPGYRGTADMALAMERGEIDGVCGWDWSSFKSQRPNWLRDHKANVLMQVSIEPHPELTKMGVPTVFKFVKDEEARKVVELVISQSVFQRSYIAPPETPPAQLEVLRKAFDDTMADKAFLADTEKLRIDIEPLPGAKVQDLVARLYTTPKDIIERARKAIRPD
jgi:tripartite-type tricarboxylate transporter receptor subunit TctC